MQNSTTTATVAVNVWEVAQGMTVHHEGGVFVVSGVETDLAATGGFVAVYMGGERVLFLPSDTLDAEVDPSVAALQNVRDAR